MKNKKKKEGRNGTIISSSSSALPFYYGYVTNTPMTVILLFLFSFYIIKILTIQIIKIQC